LQKLNVPLEDPINLTRGADPIVEPQCGCLGFAGWATPTLLVIATVSIRVMLGQPEQILFSLAFFPASLGRANDKKVWCVNDSKLSSARALVLELQWWGLVVVLENIWVMFHLMNRGQFHAMAFELNGLAHLSAGIPAAYVRLAGLDSTRWIGGPNAINEESNRCR